MHCETDAHDTLSEKSCYKKECEDFIPTSFVYIFIHEREKYAKFSVILNVMYYPVFYFHFLLVSGLVYDDQ